MSAITIREELIPTIPTDPSDAIAEAAADPVHELWWLGCHGGAGVSTIAYLTGVGRDCRQTLPHRDFQDHPNLAVALVFRISAAGLWAAQHSVQAYQALEHQPPLLGFVGVAAQHRRPRRLVRERLHLLHAHVQRLWTLPWVGAFLDVHDPAAIGVPPAYQRFTSEITSLVTVPPQAEAHGAA